MIIEINSDCARISKDFAGGKKVSKIINFSELISSLSGYQNLALGLLPSNTRIIEFKGEQVLVGIEFPAQRRLINYRTVKGFGNPSTKEISLPGGLFLAVLNKKVYNYSNGSNYIFATKGKINFTSDKLYKYPLPNIHWSGDICWGSDQKFKIEKIMSVEGLMKEFFSGVFNSDLLQDFQSPPHENLESYFKALDIEKYNDQWLVATPHTVESIIAHLFKDSK